MDIYLEYCGYLPGMLWISTWNIVDIYLEYCGYLPGMLWISTWNVVDIYLECCGYLFCMSGTKGIPPLPEAVLNIKIHSRVLMNLTQFILPNLVILEDVVPG